MSSITYDQLATCGIDFSHVFFACRVFDKKRNIKQPIESVDAVYQWRTRGIPRRFLSLIAKLVADFVRRAADKAALVAARAPQVDLFKSDDVLTRKPVLSNKNNNLDNNLSDSTPPPSC